MNTDAKVFSIDTATSCPLKWTWSTLYLNTGVTRSCHRTAESRLEKSNFENFHNTEVKIQDRRDMLAGQWPETNCRYCKDIEQLGGVSDRIRHRSIPYAQPVELNTDPTAVRISPTLLEVYFNNTCNLGCLYCSAELSSTIEQENRKWGDFDRDGVIIINRTSQYRDLVPEFWQWFDRGFKTLKRLHILGGEPFYQKKEFSKLLESIEQKPNPDCELNIVTNLMVSSDLLLDYVQKLKTLLVKRCLRKVDITCSIDCWGSQQQYVRYGLDLQQWQENFQCLMQQKWLTININQTISVLTIDTMPDLLSRLKDWRVQRRIGHYFSVVSPGPSYMRPDILGPEPFQNQMQEVLDLLPQETAEDQMAFAYMSGIFDQIKHCKPDSSEIIKLLTYLSEKDRRRGTDWREQFAFLRKWEYLVV